MLNRAKVQEQFKTIFEYQQKADSFLNYVQTKHNSFLYLYPVSLSSIRKG